ncbi:protease inhibitor I42 family protein [Methylobacterium sp. GC_Met_3]|uniref:protease inhibitor I42 family protein n=2 Tax=unclassified Methylobacterium TaxID=2615210 RepID=UPI00226A677A|nr:protease inhibitor I42 family protein [Methylobacterium sp. GC_Met_3]
MMEAVMTTLLKKRHILTAIILTCSSISSALSNDDNIIDVTPAKEETVKNSEASVSVGDTFSIKLRSGSGLPTSWQCASADESIVNVKGNGWKRADGLADGLNGGKVGYEIASIFIISAIRPGMTTVKCEYVWFTGEVNSTTKLLLNIH